MIKEHIKTIGLIGGMSWESSKIYYETINKRANDVLGASHSAKIIMVSVDFEDIKELTFAGKWDEIGAIMTKSAQQLERAGADIIMLCTNLIHLVSDAITNNTSIPFLHIADTTGEAIQKKGLKKVALLGTKFTMEKDFYTKIIQEKYGVEVIIPSEEKRKLIHNIIYDELVKGVFTESSKQICIEIIKDLQNHGAKGVIMGCTELPILIPDEDITIPTFDTGKIHSYKAVEWATGNYN